MTMSWMLRIEVMMVLRREFSSLSMLCMLTMSLRVVSRILRLYFLFTSSYFWLSSSRFSLSAASLSASGLRTFQLEDLFALFLGRWLRLYFQDDFVDFFR
jgi:hypothetical protein